LLYYLSVMKTDKGLGIIISGPSGVGKGTIIKELLKKEDIFELSTSYCTRHPRAGEVNGRDYFFISIDEFKRKIKNADFAEWANVHENYYGTDKNIFKQINEGKRIIFEIDVQGAKNLIKTFESTNTNYKSFFLLPPSMDSLHKRLKKRGTENEESLKIRSNNAKKELGESSCFKYTVVNDKIEITTNKILSIINEVSPDNTSF